MANSKLIDELVANIAHQPNRVIFSVEDSVVIDEASSAEIVSTAIRALHADAKTAAAIAQAASAIAPQRSAEIAEAAKTALSDEARMKRDYDKIEKAQLSGAAQIEEIRPAQMPEVIMRALPAHPVAPTDIKPAQATGKMPGQ